MFRLLSSPECTGVVVHKERLLYLPDLSLVFVAFLDALFEGPAGLCTLPPVLFPPRGSFFPSFVFDSFSRRLRARGRGFFLFQTADTDAGAAWAGAGTRFFL